MNTSIVWGKELDTRYEKFMGEPVSNRSYYLSWRAAEFNREYGRRPHQKHPIQQKFCAKE